MKKLEAVIFDMDGVIVHSNPMHKTILYEFLSEHDIELSEDQLREKVYGRTNKDWIPNVFGPVSDEVIEQYTNEKEQEFRDRFNPTEHVVPGFFSFLEKLTERGIKKAVGTSAPAENARHILQSLKVEDAFDTVLNASHVTKSKPNPEPYLKAAAALGVNPEQCVVIEDSISGVKSGLAAGAKVIGVTTTHTPEELRDCDLVIDNFESLSIADLEELMGELRMSEV